MRWRDHQRRRHSRGTQGPQEPAASGRQQFQLRRLKSATLSVSPCAWTRAMSHARRPHADRMRASPRHSATLMNCVAKKGYRRRSWREQGLPTGGRARAHTPTFRQSVDATSSDVQGLKHYLHDGHACGANRLELRHEWMKGADSFAR